jgi:hypothetical protein
MGSPDQGERRDGRMMLAIIPCRQQQLGGSDAHKCRVDIIALRYCPLTIQSEVDLEALLSACVHSCAPIDLRRGLHE